MDEDLKVTLPEAMEIVFACIKELDLRIKALENRFASADED